jgi:hypothetical protein
MTFAAGGTAEVIGSALVTMTKGETMAAYVALMDSTFASVDAQRRIDLGLGRLRVLSPITAWQFRRPVQWAASTREYNHDVHIPCWAKDQGPLLGFSMLDADGRIVEFDERTNGGGLAGRFTCARTWGNGPNGAFIALSLTRSAEGTLLSRTQNMAVANVACAVVQAATENIIGKVLQLNQDGTATQDSIGRLESGVNTELSLALLQQGLEGPRASSAVWKASTTDVLSVLPATVTGVLSLKLGAAVEQINTVVRVS